MSQENVELVKKLFAVYNARSFEENVDLIDPDMVWDMSRVELPDASSYIGREFSGFVESWDEGFASERMEPQEIIDAGDRIVVAVYDSARGKTSGIEVEQHFAMVWTIRDGRAVRMDIYPPRKDAL